MFKSNCFSLVVYLLLKRKQKGKQCTVVHMVNKPEPFDHMGEN